ncbi:hypothetical protein K8T06_03820 [bacterium]|nr:hypothetical protein [bacterium]
MLSLKKTIKRFRRFIAGLLASGSVEFINLLNKQFSIKLADGLGWIMYNFSKKDRERILENFDRVFGTSLTYQEKTLLGRRVCQNLARSAIEAIQIRDMSSDDIQAAIDDNNFANKINEIFKAGRSIMMITGHYGNWELFAARVAQMGPLTVLARKNSNPRIEKIIQNVRDKSEIHVLERSDPRTPREMIQMGKKGGHILGILMDQDTSRIQGIFSPFMNMTALTPSGPASIGIRDLYEIYVAVLRPIKNGRHEFIIEGPIKIPEEGDRTSKIQQLTDRFNAILSRIILEAPEYWVWNHRRWRHQPEDTQENRKS